MFLDYFNKLMLKIKKYYFNLFLNNLINNRYNPTKYI